MSEDARGRVFSSRGASADLAEHVACGPCARPRRTYRGLRDAELRMSAGCLTTRMNALG